MGINQDHAVAGLADDEVFVDLRPRRPKRQIDGLRLRFGLDTCGRGLGEARQSRPFGRFRHATTRSKRRSIHLVHTRLRLERLDRLYSHRGRCPVALGGQGRAQSADDQASRRLRIAEPHLRFRRMYVHIDQHRIAVNEQHGRRVAIPAEHVHIACPERTGQRLVPHRPSVDVDVLMHR